MAVAEKSKNTRAMAGTENDAMDRLSLSIIPLSSNTLKNARLIKNARMETAVELHNDPISGSLQIMPEDISDAFSGAEQDQAIITALAALNSYDVYSMRSSFKALGIPVGQESLSLSDSMKTALNDYTVEFIRPLIEKIFGSGHMDIVVTGNESLTQILEDSDAARVRKNLQTISSRTGIPIDEIPAFLETYSDVFLSVAYYRHCFENVGQDIQRFLGWINEMQKLRDISSSAQSMSSCKKVEKSMQVINASINERLAKFHQGFEAFWCNINKESFDLLRQQIEDNHSSMGSVLCGLVVKMNRWSREFPDNTVGGPQQKVKFIMTEMEPGLESLRLMEMEARKKIGLPA